MHDSQGEKTTSAECEKNTKFESEDDYYKENDESEDVNDVLSFIELKYCSVCTLEQPLRTKHCNQCNSCVATHDHHCPWVGNCIGERNKFYFYIFLWIQLFQVLAGLTIGTDLEIADTFEGQDLIQGLGEKD